MKFKIISLFLALCTAFFQVAFAEGENGLDDAVAVARERLEIPSHYSDFYSQIEQSNNGRIYRLSWSGEGDSEKTGGYASASVDEMGRIMYYSHYEYGNFEGDYKLSELDRDGAAEIASESIKRMCPEFYGSIKAVNEENYHERNYNNYYIRFYRFENGIPYYSNYITAAINARNKKLAELQVKWDDIKGFPLGDGVIPEDEAKALFAEKIGISLFYADSADGSPALLYRAGITGRKYINAFTGEITDTGISSGPFAADTADFEINFSSLQLEFSDMQENLLSVEQLEKSVRERLELSNNAALGEARLVGDLYGSSYYHMTFVTEKKLLILVTINARTKEIIGYNVNGDYSENILVTEAFAYNKAKEFAQRISDKYNYCSQNTNAVIKANYNNNGYTFIFPRIVNGLQYLNNGISVTISGATGEVMSYECSWRQGAFPSAATEITAEKAADELFARAGFGLQHVAVAKKGIIYPRNASDLEIRLVYNLTPGKPLFVNTKTGGLCYPDGRAYSDDLTVKYSDVEGHPSEKYIKTLHSSGVLKGTEYFRPDENITQKDYLLWIYNSAKQYTPDNTNDLYFNLYYYNVLTEEERSDDAEITFEEAIKYLIRLLGYTDVAELEDTYVTTFFDEASITHEYIGYAAISQGLGIVKGNAFTPKRLVTRATAAEIIYNLIAQNIKAD